MRIRININIPVELVCRVDRICRIIHHPKPNRSAACEEALHVWCDRQEAKLREEGKLDDDACTE